MMFGWDTAAADSASRANRALAVGSSANSGDRTFTTTSRFNAGSRARNTVPIPPWPIWRSSWNSGDRTFTTTSLTLPLHVMSVTYKPLCIQGRRPFGSTSQRG